mgnify:FL=1
MIGSCGAKWGPLRESGFPVLLLTGQYFHAFDAKGRLTIPSKLREQINRAEDCHVFMASCGLDDVLYLYTRNTYKEVAPRFKPSLRTVAEVRDYERLAYSMTERLELDRLGRLLIPEYMRSLANLSKDVAIIGVRDHIEIWDREKWQAFVTERMEKQNELASRAMAVAETGVAPDDAREGGAEASAGDVT